MFLVIIVLCFYGLMVLILVYVKYFKCMFYFYVNKKYLYDKGLGF